MNDLKIKKKKKEKHPGGRVYCFKGLVGGKFKAYPSAALYGQLTALSRRLTAARSPCLSPYFYLRAYLLPVISRCVTEYFGPGAVIYCWSGCVLSDSPLAA